MGACESSLWQYSDNDFELVVRVAKELDEALKNDFNAGHHRQLGDKIEFVKGNLSAINISRMRHLVKLRDDLVHNYDCNSLRVLGTSHNKFVLMYEEVKEELDTARRSRGRPANQCNEESSLVSFTSSNRAQMQQVENGGGWAMLGALAVAGVAAVAVASANDESSEQRGADRRRRDSSSRSYY